MLKVAFSQVQNNLSESESRSIVSDSLWPHGTYSLWNSPGQNTGVGSLSHWKGWNIQGIFPTQGSNRSLLHHRQISYQLSSQGSPKQPYHLANSVIVSLNGRTRCQNWSAWQSPIRSIPLNFLSICTCGLYTLLSIHHLETAFGLFCACVCVQNEYLFVNKLILNEWSHNWGNYLWCYIKLVVKSILFDFRSSVFSIWLYRLCLGAGWPFI